MEFAILLGIALVIGIGIFARRNTGGGDGESGSFLFWGGGDSDGGRGLAGMTAMVAAGTVAGTVAATR